MSKTLLRNCFYINTYTGLGSPIGAVPTLWVRAGRPFPRRWPRTLLGPLGHHSFKGRIREVGHWPPSLSSAPSPVVCPAAVPHLPGTAGPARCTASAALPAFQIPVRPHTGRTGGYILGRLCQCRRS